MFNWMNLIYFNTINFFQLKCSNLIIGTETEIHSELFYECNDILLISNALKFDHYNVSIARIGICSSNFFFFYTYHLHL